MCGIFGFSFKEGRLSAARRAILATNLAIGNDMRGGDSWGIVGFEGDGIRVLRGLNDLSDHAFELCEYNTLFAHTRKATHGDATIKNAHPFKVGKILGAHNGIIFNHEELCKKYKRPFEVDSQHIFAHLNEDKPFSELEGYGSIEWINSDNKKRINLAKLRGGELAIFGIGNNKKDFDGIVWSSSDRHLSRALLCAGIDDLVRFQVNTGRVFCVENGRLFIDGSRTLELSMPFMEMMMAMNGSSDDDLEEEVAKSNPGVHAHKWQMDRIREGNVRNFRADA